MRSWVELFTFPEQLPGPARFGKGLGVKGLPFCASESFQQKSKRFVKDVTAVADELRTLLSEIRKLYNDHSHESVGQSESAIETAFDEWQAFGFNEWFEPVSNVDLKLFDDIAEWAARFHRAGRVADGANSNNGFSHPLPLDLMGQLPDCLTRNWTPGQGNKLRRVFHELLEHSKTLTKAADMWTYMQISMESTPPEEGDTPQTTTNIARTYDPVELAEMKETTIEFGAPITGPTVPTCASEYVKHPTKAAKDIKDAVAKFDEAWGAILEESSEGEYRWRFSKHSLGDLADLWVLDRLRFISRCVVMASNHKPGLFGLLIPERSEPSWLTNLEVFLQEALRKGQEVFYLAEHPLAELTESLYMFSDMLEFEMLTKTCKDPTPSAVNLAEQENAGVENASTVAAAETVARLNPETEKPPGANYNSESLSDSVAVVVTADCQGQPDGPCEDSNMFHIGGQRVGPFTDTEFDVLKLMWEHSDLQWPQKDAHFKFYESFGWPQSSDGSPFGRHQTSIKKSFNSSGLELPWKLKRRAFHWLGAKPLEDVSER